jgi:hypothetical protein
MNNKKIKPEDFKFEIEEVIGVIKESDKHDWCKAITKISWNKNPATIDIRNINMSENKVGKGISLSDEEADKLTNILLENDFGSLESLEKALKKKKDRFTISVNADKSFADEDNNYLVIDI